MPLLSRLWQTLWFAGMGFVRHRAPRMAAAIAFYAVVSLAPTLFFAISVVGIVFGRRAARDEVRGAIADTVGEEPARQIQDAIRELDRQPVGVAASVAAFFALVFGATGVFVALKGSLNTVWEAPERHEPIRRSVLRLLRARLVALAMVIGVSYLFMLGLFTSAAFTGAIGSLGDIPGWVFVARGVEIALFLLVSAAVFAVIFKTLPDVRLRWRDVLPGAAVTAAAFWVGRWAVGLYLGRSAVASVYGAAGSIVLVLLWVYYTANIVLVGAELTRSWIMHGRGERPERAPRNETPPAEGPGASGEHRAAKAE